MSREVKTWLESNSTKIQSKLDAHRQWLIKKAPYPEELNLGNRSLPEMDLCVAMTQIELPEGYKVKRGSVNVEGEREHFHVFAVKDNQVLCLNPGWFEVLVGGEGKPGEAVRRLINRAPELFRSEGDVVALNGEVGEIKKKLGLEYKWE